jgi:signal transduction histidine kinase
MAPALVEAGLTKTHLAPIAAAFSGDGLSDALRWLQVTVQEAALLREMDESTRRITGLVKAVKEYSYMDQAPAQQVNLHEGLDSTLTMLNHKLKQAKVKVVRDYDPHLPTLFAYGSELNQVWTNLIDNAIDALSESPQAERVLTIRTAHVSDRVQVEITDNGPGIPEAIQNRIFDPFFTTKGVGQGTGLGLDIAFRIVVMRHHGDIKLHTEPGSTHFRVCLPIEQ